MATRILVVEDDSGIARLLNDNLTIDGFDVRVAPTGHEALRGCQSFVPDLVLLDVKLPDADGFALCQLLRQGGQRPVIFVTARGLRADKMHGRLRDDVVELAVRDYGVGIDPGELERVKQRFIRGRTAKGRGSGLGLAIVSRIAADHGGWLRLESSKESGTTAVIALPGDRNEAWPRAS